MSRRAAQKFTATPPSIPPAQQQGDANQKFAMGVVSWMNQMALAYNRSVEATQRDNASTATVIPHYDSSGIPDTIYYCINAFLGPDGVLHAINKQASAWALRFTLTTDLFEVLYCAPLTDPIVWTTYFSVTSAGVYSGIDERTYITLNNEATTLTKSRRLVGTANRITLTDAGVGSTLTADIAATYAGQTSIVTLGTITTGTWTATAVDATHGGTGQTAVSTGDLLYGSGANVWSRLSANATATNKFLRSVSSTAPSWEVLVAGDIPDLSAYYAPIDYIEHFSGVGTASADQNTAATSWTRLNSTISGQNGIQYTNSSGRTKTVTARVLCTVATDGGHAGWWRLSASGTGVSVTRQGGVRTSSGVYVPATLEILLTVTTGNTVTIFIEAEVAAGGTAYLVETGDGIWTMIGQAVG